MSSIFTHESHSILYVPVCDIGLPTYDDGDVRVVQFRQSRQDKHELADSILNVMKTEKAAREERWKVTDFKRMDGDLVETLPGLTLQTISFRTSLFTKTLQEAFQNNYAFFPLFVQSKGALTSLPIVIALQGLRLLILLNLRSRPITVIRGKGHHGARSKEQAGRNATAELVDSSARNEKSGKSIKKRVMESAPMMAFCLRLL
ncbi:hypothetical protein AVEN_54353-1 [Araneus ventricosus]|uniref:Uncharacterized protein n=1 Tax=Araneus ventricosus TaxID=182803 RepID=A0A4Y2S4K2_ARAVE|nr:hypothetical protein AVEN_54353-1 [Araneus ventricosus]